jgi:ABC-2 type transport system permease protein
MKTLLDSELLKLRTVRLPWIVAAVAGVLATIIGVALVRVSVTDPPADGHRLALAEIAKGPVQLLWFVLVGVVIVATAGEFQHRTLRTTLLLHPSRVQVLLAKVVVSAVLGVVVSVLGMVLAVAAGALTALTSHISLGWGSAQQWAQVAGAVGLAGLWSVVGVGLGMLTRSATIAITTLLLWRFVGEGLLPLVLNNPGISRWTPSGAGNALVGMGGPSSLPGWGAALLFVAYTAAICGLASVLFLRRDPA